MADVLEQDEKQQVFHALVRCAQVFLQRHDECKQPTAMLLLFWEEFYRESAASITRKVEAAGINAADRDDIEQQVWKAIVEKLPEFKWQENNQGFLAWMDRVIRSKISDFYRRQPPAATSMCQILDSQHEPEQAGNNPVDHVLTRERSRMLHLVLEEIGSQTTAENVEILGLRYWDGYDVPSIADRIGLNPELVNTRLHRLRQRIRQRLLQRYPNYFLETI